MRKSKYTKELLAPLVKDSISFAEVIKKLGLSLSGGNYRYIKFRIEYLELDTIHFKGRGWSKNLTSEEHPSIDSMRIKQRRPNGEIFIRNSPESNGDRLKKRLLELGWEYKCSLCRILEWRGEKLTLQIDHINGINNDNRLENLRFLCPNCHSQTSTFGNKNKCYDKIKCVKKNKKIVIKKVRCKNCSKELVKKRKTGLCRSCYKPFRKVENRPTEKQLLKDIENLGYCGTGRKYGVSDNAIRKWIR